MTTRRLTIIEMVILVLATVILFMALLTFSANAQELTSVAGKTTIENYKHEKGPVSIKPSSNNSTKPSSNNSTKADILRQRGVPGKGIDHAPGLQKPFNPKSNAAQNAGNKNGKHQSDDEDDDDEDNDNPNSDNRTPPISGNQTITNAKIFKQSGLPGKGIELASELPKPFYPDADKDAGINKFLYRWQQRFQEMMKNFRWTNR